MRSFLFAMFAALAVAACEGDDLGPPNLPERRDGEVEITERGPLLNSDGTLRVAGWSRRETLTFNGEVIHGEPLSRLRRWDFYAVQNTAGTFSLTVMDIGFITLCAFDWLDLKTGETATAALPQLSNEVEIRLSDGGYDSTRCGRRGDPSPVLSFDTVGNERRLRFDFPATSWGPAVSGSFVLHEHEEQEYLALVTPFPSDPFSFFYEQKIPGSVAEGTLQIDGALHAFAATDAVAFMDWGRGVWPHQLMWRWGGAGGRLADGRRFGLNLGNGFGDTSYASANLLVIDGKAHKLGVVEWTYDRAHPEKPWRFRSPDGNVDLTLTPTQPAKTGVNLVLKYADMTKAYGALQGAIRLDDGARVELDTATAFAEDVQIRW
jgi:hypothetical protein